MKREPRDWVLLGIKLAVLAFVVKPLVPGSRVRWYYTMKLTQQVAAGIGSFAIHAENRYHQAVREF